MRLTRLSLAAFYLVTAWLPLSLPSLSARACPCSEYKRQSDPKAKVGSDVGLEYSNSKEFKQEFKKTVRAAKKYCKQYRRQNPDAINLAIVSDIDETLIDNRGLFDRIDKFSWPEFIKWIHEAEAPTLKPTEDFLRWARQRGYSIFLITGRPEKLRGSTIRNLVRNQISFDGLYHRPDGDKRSAIDVKTEIRKRIEDMGFKIVVNIGDQDSDLIGGHAEDCQKLPNRLYHVK